METNCPICQAENLTDFPVCPTCATTRHFQYRNDCRCAPCQVERAEIVNISGLNDLPQFVAVDDKYRPIRADIDPDCDYEAEHDEWVAYNSSSIDLPW